MAAAPSFKLIHSDLSAQCREIAVEGELDFAISDRLREAIAAVDRGIVLIDLERCEFIDSSGIAVLIWARRELATEGRRVFVSGQSGQVARLLSLTGLAPDYVSRALELAAA